MPCQRRANKEASTAINSKWLITNVYISINNHLEVMQVKMTDIQSLKYQSTINIFIKNNSVG